MNERRHNSLSPLRRRRATHLSSTFRATRFLSPGLPSIGLRISRRPPLKLYSYERTDGKTGIRQRSQRAGPLHLPRQRGSVLHALHTLPLTIASRLGPEGGLQEALASLLLCPRFVEKDRKRENKKECSSVLDLADSCRLLVADVLRFHKGAAAAWDAARLRRPQRDGEVAA